MLFCWIGITYLRCTRSMARVEKDNVWLSPTIPDSKWVQRFSCFYDGTRWTSNRVNWRVTVFQINFELDKSFFFSTRWLYVKCIFIPILDLKPRRKFNRLKRTELWTMKNDLNSAASFPGYFRYFIYTTFGNDVMSYVCQRLFRHIAKQYVYIQ